MPSSSFAARHRDQLRRQRRFRIGQAFGNQYVTDVFTVAPGTFP